MATGAGHHAVFQAPATGTWHIPYHQRPLGETDRNHRVVSIASRHFDTTGMIAPVVIAKEGVRADPIKR